MRPAFLATLALFKAGADDLRAFLGPGPILTDDRPLTEFSSVCPRDRGIDLTGLTGDVARYLVQD